MPNGTGAGNTETFYFADYGKAVNTSAVSYRYDESVAAGSRVYDDGRRLQEVELTDAGVSSRLDESASGDGIYENMDRFGRLKEKNWIKTSQIDGFAYTYDYASNRTACDDSLGTSLDQTFIRPTGRAVCSFSDSDLARAIPPPAVRRLGITYWRHAAARFREPR